MKIDGIPLLMVLGFAGLGAAGLAGCGSDSTSGDGGSGGSGGGSGDGSVTHALSYTFDSSVQGWFLNDYCETAAATNVNLGCKPAADSGVTFDAGVAGMPALAFDATNGSPSAGSIKVTVTFSAYRQYVDAIINTNSPEIDLSGKVLHAKLRLTSGVFAGGAQVHASTVGWTYYGSNPFPTLALGTWADGSLMMDTVPIINWDPKKVTQVGVQIYSGEPPPTDPTAAYPNAGTEVVFNVDTFQD